MEGIQSFTICLIAVFGIVGTFCELQNSEISLNTKLSNETDPKVLFKRREVFQEVDQDERRGMVKKRVPRLTPYEGYHFHPTDQEMARARARAQSRRNENNRILEQEANARLQQQQRDGAAGGRGTTERIINVQHQRQRKNNSQQRRTNQP